MFAGLLAVATLATYAINIGNTPSHYLEHDDETQEPAFRQGHAQILIVPMPQIIEKKTLHSGYLEVVALRLRLPDGEEIAREVVDHGRSVAVLPYDPARRVALLVRLLRAPALLSTGAKEILEAPAGMVEEDTPEKTAARELEEEVGLKVARLDHVGCVFTSPGVSTERMDLFLAAYAQADRTGAGGGLADEHENITVCEMPLDALWAMGQRNEIADMKTLTLLLALKVRQPQLFGGA